MKKSTLIVIGIIYIASIVIISIFGLKTKIYDQVIPVSSIECLNETDSKSTVTTTADGKKLIRVKYDEPGRLDEHGVPRGTMVQISYRVLPDNATNKDVRFVYNTELTRANFLKNTDGEEMGLILFTGKVKLDLSIVSVDGTRVTEDIVIWVY